MPRIHLTDLSVRTLKPCDVPTTFWDTSLPAFGVRVGKRTKTFLVMHGRDRKRIAVGKYPDTPLQKARGRAKDLLRSPIDRPVETVTVFDAYDEYLRHHIQPNYRPRSAYMVDWMLRKYLVQFNTKNIADLTTRELTRLLSSMSGTPSQANHLHGTLRTFFSWCEQRDYIEKSPLAKVPKPYREKSRERVLSDDELMGVLRACGTDRFSLVVQFCARTGQRRGEVAAMKPEWIGKDTVAFPSIITKNGKEHILPLTPYLVGLAQQIAALPPFVAWGKPKKAFDAVCKVESWTIHDLRRTWATKAAQWQAAPPHIIERILNHAAPSSLGGAIGVTYNKWAYLDEMRAAMLAFEQKLDALLQARSL